MSVTSYKVPSAQPVGPDSNPEGTGSIKHSPFPLACVSNVFEESVFATQENCLTQGENQSSTVHKGEIYNNGTCVKRHHAIPKLNTTVVTADENGDLPVSVATLAPFTHSSSK